MKYQTLPCWLFLLLFFCNFLRASDELVPFCELEEKSEDKYFFVEDKCLRHASYKNLKAAFLEAQAKKDIPVLVAIYFLSRQKQCFNTANAVMLGGMSFYFTVWAPLTLGMTLIVGVPIGAFCGYSSVKAHKIRKLKRRAKEALDFLVPSEIYLQITQAKTTEDFAGIRKTLQEKNIFVHKQNQVLFDVLLSKMQE